ncbi:ABC transporter ATP-binding protein [Candidatus Peregrinibacteria bacterium]|nr:ABC transporter ATP-binding protein [Candidatus Peregrinibacteria bacterium]
MLSFFQLTKNYGIQTVLDEVNFQVNAGEFVAILGASGSGKSTLISLLIGADKPTSGSISIDGITIEELSPGELQLYRQQIGVVFQDFKLLEKKTVFENVAFVLEVCGELEIEIEHKVGAILERVGLTGMSHKFPHQLSGGEQQRVAIARALVHSPKLLIADEPTGNLDPRNTRDIGSLLSKFNKEDHLTVIVTTHDPVFLKSIVKPRVLKLEHKKIHEDTTWEKTFEFGGEEKEEGV